MIYVLILVVMDDALAQFNIQFECVVITVLILVVMDDALALDKDDTKDKHCLVLILVVMDDALAHNIFVLFLFVSKVS